MKRILRINGLDYPVYEEEEHGGACAMTVPISSFWGDQSRSYESPNKFTRFLLQDGELSVFWGTTKQARILEIIGPDPAHGYNPDGIARCADGRKYPIKYSFIRLKPEQAEKVYRERMIDATREQAQAKRQDIPAEETPPWRQKKHRVQRPCATWSKEEWQDFHHRMIDYQRRLNENDPALKAMFAALTPEQRDAYDNFCATMYGEWERWVQWIGDLSLFLIDLHEQILKREHTLAELENLRAKFREERNSMQAFADGCEGKIFHPQAADFVRWLFDMGTKLLTEAIDAREKERAPQFDPAILTRIAEALESIKQNPMPSALEDSLLRYTRQIAENTGHIASIPPALERQIEQAEKRHATNDAMTDQLRELKQTVKEQIPAAIRHYKAKAEMTDEETKRRALEILETLTGDDASPTRKARLIEAFHLRNAGKTIDEIAAKLGIHKSQVSGLFQDIERMAGIPFTGRKVARGAHDGTHYKKNGAQRDTTHRAPPSDDSTCDDK